MAWRNESRRHSLASKGIKTAVAGIPTVKVPIKPRTYLTDREIKVYGEAYDKLYDLNSATSYKFQKELDKLASEAKKKGYAFKLNQRTDKWQLKRAD